MAKLFLVNIQTSVEVTAEDEIDAMMIVSTSDNHNNRIVDSDIMLVDIADTDKQRCYCDECEALL